MRFHRWSSLCFSWLLVAAAACSSGTTGTSNSNGNGAQSTCLGDSMSCDGLCVDVRTSALQCGACGHACGSGLVCSLGTCSNSCASGLTTCGSDCADTNTSTAHCGGCNSRCSGSCVAGRCNASTGGPGSANAGNSGGNSGNGATQGGAGNAGSGATQGGGSGNGGKSGGAGAGGAAGSAPTGAFGGYITSGDWHGFAWTATSTNGGTISPKNFGTSFDFPLCANGNVMTGDSNVAMVGWNLNQTTVDGDPALMVSPKLKGITVATTNKGGSELRLQLQGPNGATDANDRWCAIIPGTGGFIPYDAFNTECWAGGMGMAYTGQPIVAAIVLVPGKVGSAVSFDFCVTKLSETDESGGTPSQGCSLSSGSGEGSGTISGSDTRAVTRDGHQYVVQNNVWNGNSSNQTLTVSGVSFTVTAQGNSQPTTGAPTGFPSVFTGSNFGHATSGSGLPKQVSALTSVQTGWRWSGSTGTHNAAYDVWFSTNAGGDSNNPSGAYLMVWYYRSDASNVVPLGSPMGTASIGGKSWQVWICNGACQNNVPVISYTPAQQSDKISEWSYDLNDFIKHAVGQGTIKSNWYLTNIFAGFEIWSGGTGLKTENFCAIVN